MWDGQGIDIGASQERVSVGDLSLKSELRAAIHGDELCLHYQPKISHDGCRVVGVETARALDVLTLLGCDHFQGYHMSRPLGSGELLQWLEESERACAPEVM